MSKHIVSHVVAAFFMTTSRNLFIIYWVLLWSPSRWPRRSLEPRRRLFAEELMELKSEIKIFTFACFAFSRWALINCERISSEGLRKARRLKSFKPQRPRLAGLFSLFSRPVSSSPLHLMRRVADSWISELRYLIIALGLDLHTRKAVKRCPCHGFGQQKVSSLFLPINRAHRGLSRRTAAGRVQTKMRRNKLPALADEMRKKLESFKCKS
jgi:hypothetical protein